MVRCMLHGKFYETCLEEEARDVAMEEESSDVGGLNVSVEEKSENVLEAEARCELGDAFHDTKIISSHFDHLGRPRLKIVYVDIGEYFADTPSEACERSSEHILTVTRVEEEREKRDGIPRPRLIFVKQDRDYWPGSECDPDVMARRAAKELKAHPHKPDYNEIFVPRLPEQEKPWPEFFANDEAKKAFYRVVSRRNFMRYFDPSMPGTKFIIDHLPDQRASVLSTYKKDPDLWKEWMRISQPDTSQPDTTPALAVNEDCEEMLVCNTT